MAATSTACSSRPPNQPPDFASERTRRAGPRAAPPELLLASTPLAGALHAGASTAPVPSDGGRDFTGRWVHAFAAYGAPKYGSEFTHFEYVNPDAP